MHAIHQILPTFVGGDAIGNFAVDIQRALGRLGYASRIYADSIEPAMRTRALPLRHHARHARADDGVIYHHSIGSRVVEYLAHVAGPKIMIYHNITPGCYVRPYNARLASLLDAGRRQLPELAGWFDLALGVSRYNARDLSDAGFACVGVLPIAFDPVAFERVAFDADAARRCGPDAANILFVGRLVPHKCAHELLDWFDRYAAETARPVRLILVGPLDDRFERYNRSLLDQARAARGRVVMTGKVTQAQLVTYYRCADVFCSFSEHEGFMVPLLEAMGTDTAIVAFDIPAVRETLDGAGVLFDRKTPAVVSALVDELLSNGQLRAGLLARQRRRLAYFAPKRFEQRLRRVLALWRVLRGDKQDASVACGAGDPTLR